MRPRPWYAAQAPVPCLAEKTPSKPGPRRALSPAPRGMSCGAQHRTEACAAYSAEGRSLPHAPLTPDQPPATTNQPPHGFTLLEVILALGIFLGALAVIGELSRAALDNARMTRETCEAQLLCESILAEVVAGIAPLEPVYGAPIESANVEGDPPWFYSLDIVPIDQEGLLALEVTVTREYPTGQRPVSVTLVRWMVDPAAVAMTTEPW